MSGFWIYSFVTALLVPLILMLCGYLLYYKTPKRINGFYGYRTKMSRKNQKTWDFANQYCGRVWMLMGSGMLPISVLCMKMVVDADVNTIGMWNGILVTIQLSRYFFNPIKKLGEAMGKVADGDFTVELNSRSTAKEIQEIFTGFNLMTHELRSTEILQLDFV